MKNFIKTLMKLAFTVASICAFAAAAYYLFKKFVKPAAQPVDVEEETTEAAAPSEEPTNEDEEKPSVNRKYVNIVLDWDQAVEGNAETAPVDEAAPAEEIVSVDEAAEVLEENTVPAEKVSEDTVSTDSSIHLND